MQPVKAVLLQLVADGELDANPVPKKLKLKEKRVEEIEPYGDDELKKLFRAARRPAFRHYENLIHFVFESGFRPEENYGMQWARVDLKALAYKVREVFTLGKLKAAPKTEFAERDADLTAGMAEWIRRQKAQSFLRGPFVWITPAARPVDQSAFAKNVWRPLHDAARVKY